MNFSHSHQINRGISPTAGDCNEDDLKMIKVIPSSNEGSLQSFFLDRRLSKPVVLKADDDHTEITTSETEYSYSLNGSSWHSSHGFRAAKQPLTVAADAVSERVENIDVTALQPLCLLGEGFFGKVWLVTDCENRSFSLKKLSKYELLCEDQVHAVVREKQILLQLHHPGIVRLHAAYQDASHIYLLQPFVPGGELFSVLHGSRPSESQAQFYTACLTDALWYLHCRHCVAYRDLKPENVVMDAAGYPVLVDFGCAKQMLRRDAGGSCEMTTTYTLCGTSKYLPPEMVQGAGHSFAVDYWSLGVVVYELLSGGENPFEFWQGMDEMSLYRSIAEADYLDLPEGAVSAAGADLIDRLLTKNPDLRLGSVESVTENEVLGHKWLRDMDVVALRNRSVPAPWVPVLQDALDTSHFDSSITHQQQQGETEDDDSLARENNPRLTAKEQARFADFDSC